MNAILISDTEMITLEMRLEDFDLPEGNWELSKAYVGTNFHGTRPTDDPKYCYEGVHVKFVRKLEV